MLCIKEKFDFFFASKLRYIFTSIELRHISLGTLHSLPLTRHGAAARRRRLLAILFVHIHFFYEYQFIICVCAVYMVEFELEILVHALIVVNSTVFFFYAITRIMMMRYFYSACAFH